MVTQIERAARIERVKTGYDGAKRGEHSRCNKWKTPWSQYNPHWLKGGSTHPAECATAEKKSATG